MRWPIAMRERASPSLVSPQRADGASGDHALHAGRNERTKSPEPEHLLVGAEAAGMQLMPEIAAGEHGDESSAHLRPKQDLACGASGASQGEARARPKRGGEDVKRKDDQDEQRHDRAPRRG